MEYKRPEAILLGLLQVLGRDVTRTKLVKLTYLMDEANYRLRGETMTGYEYIFDYYGPNAEGNAIVEVLDEMNEDGLVDIQVREMLGDRTMYLYRDIGKVAPNDLPLSGEDWLEILAAVRKYGQMNREQIVTASKDTAPMRNAVQFQRLQFQQDAVLTDDEIAGSAFWQETVAGINNSSQRIPIEEIRQQIGQSHTSHYRQSSHQDLFEPRST